MQQLLPKATERIWHPHPLHDRRKRPYLVSFLVAEEATWDHRFHDLDGRELRSGELLLSPSDFFSLQARCDGVVGASRINILQQVPAAAERP